MTSTHKVALVTGAASGIGKATAIALQSAGYVTYATARRPETLPVLQALGLHPLQLDVTDEASMNAAIHTVEAENGGVDVLVNNASYGEMGPVEEISIERVRRQFETNVFGLIRLSQLVLPSMRCKGWGRIVNVSSMGGEFTTPLAGVYHASKYAVESISDALRFEVEPFGVDVIIIQPGAVRTSLAEATFHSIQADSNSPYIAQVEGFQRMAEANVRQGSAVLEPEDVASVIVEAVAAEQPLTRYKVGLLAEQMTMMRSHFSDREWDAMFRHQFGLPESVRA